MGVVGRRFLAGGGIIVLWIIHLIRASWRLDDVLSASVGISIVAIPIFLVFIGRGLLCLLGRGTAWEGS